MTTKFTATLPAMPVIPAAARAAITEAFGRPAPAAMKRLKLGCTVAGMTPDSAATRKLRASALALAGPAIPKGHARQLAVTFVGAAADAGGVTG